MADELLPKPLGDTSSTPVRLTPEQEELCRRMDELHALDQLQAKPSDMFRGALSVIEDENNPDRIAQAAHSLREILYPIKIDQVRKALEKYGSVFLDVSFKKTYGRLNYLAHHGVSSTKLDFLSVTRTDFDELVEAFVTLMQTALIRPMDVHRSIDQFLSGDPPQGSNRIRETTMTIQAQPIMDEEQIFKLINVDLDARRYFFHKADERWLDWLWRNGFLDAIKEEAATPFSTRIPELDYLLRMAEKLPEIVVDIMLATPISTDTRSQEVAYGFLRVCRVLPADQLARVVGKIRSERWIPLIDAIYTHSSFECEEMLKTLADERYFESLLVLAEAVLAVRPKEELENAPLHRNNPFYLEYLTRTGIFSLLASLETEYAEAALTLATQKLSEVLATSNNFWLLEVDFFSLQLEQAKLWQEEEVHELAAVVKTLAVRLIGKRCNNAQVARDVYVRHFVSLPDSRVIRRLKFYVLSLCPSAFKDYLRQAFFSLFEADNYYDVSSGTEYKKVLRKGFHVLSAEDRKHFIERILDTFGRKLDKKQYGSHILSMILPYLNELPDLKERVEKEGFVLSPDYEPRPDIDMGDGAARIVSSRAPVSQEEFGQLPLAEIAKRLRHEWTPADLNARNTEDDFYNPMNASGVGDRLQNDMPERLQQYADYASLFFDRIALDQHYTYAFLVGIQEAIKNHRELASEVKWDGVLDLCCAIRDSGEREPFERGQRVSGWHDTWLADWDAVHSAMADALRELLTIQDGLTPVDYGRYRDQIFGSVTYLLTHPDPSPEDEQFKITESALGIKAMHEDADGRWATDPLTMAINTVRGRAFDVFNLFVVLDGEKIKSDVQQLYEEVLLRENTRALMFMFGRYLSNIYFRDKDWTRRLLPRIFSQSAAKIWLYSAAWEGHLSARLYGEMFSDPAIQDLYRRALDLTDDDYPLRQRHFKDPDEGIAEHLALAFMHYKEFGLDHPLLKAFWKKENPKQHAHFVQSLGRFFISRDNSEEFFTNNPKSKNRLRNFWDWLLKEQEKQALFKEFGLWINLDKGIFDPVWLARRIKQTLEKTNGLLKWQYELIRSAPQLAQAAPEDTLKIARLYFLEGGVRGNVQRTLWQWDSGHKWLEAFEILYRCQKTKLETTALINQLVGEGGREFWPLKKILAENP